MPRLVPVRRRVRPDYPTWELVRRHPSLLATAVPRRWRGKEGVTAALAAATLGLAGTAAAATDALATPPAPDGKRPAALVFTHGDGRGAFGCVAIAAPAFLNEEEARQVIQEELARTGLAFAADAKTLPKLTRERTLVEYEAPPRNGEVRATSEEQKDAKAHDLVLDGYDATAKVGYEFVSRDDYEALGGTDSGTSVRIAKDGTRSQVGISVSSVDYQDSARYVAKKLEGAGDVGDVGDVGTIALFYEPLPTFVLRTGFHVEGGEEWHKDADSARAAAREDLRQQVRDFAEWLKAQGLLR